MSRFIYYFLLHSHLLVSLNPSFRAVRGRRKFIDPLPQSQVLIEPLLERIETSHRLPMVHYVFHDDIGLLERVLARPPCVYPLGDVPEQIQLKFYERRNEVHRLRIVKSDSDMRRETSALV